MCIGEELVSNTISLISSGNKESPRPNNQVNMSLVMEQVPEKLSEKVIALYGVR